MQSKLEYSFDDEVAHKFCYDMDNNRIEIYFGGYYDTLSRQYIDKPCIWIIKDWADAKSKPSSESTYNDLEQHLGIVSMVLSVEINNSNLELTVSTIDNRYIDLLFYNPKLKIDVE